MSALTNYLSNVFQYAPLSTRPDWKETFDFTLNPHPRSPEKAWATAFAKP